jgi:hypothetical protein
MATPETRPAEDAATWAETGDQSADGGAVASGWAASSVPPSRQRFNWVFHKIHQIGRYLLHRGIPDYASSCTYVAGDRVQGSDGNTYVCILANTPASAQDPTTATTYWSRWGHTQAQVDARVAANAATAAFYFGTGGVAATGSSTVGVVSVSALTTTQGSTHLKTVYVTLGLALTSGFNDAEITLSDACLFAGAADNVVATISNWSGGIVVTPLIRAQVTGANTIGVHVSSMGSATFVTVHLAIQGT